MVPRNIWIALAATAVGLAAWGLNVVFGADHTIATVAVVGGGLAAALFFYLAFLDWLKEQRRASKPPKPTVSDIQVFPAPHYDIDVREHVLQVFSVIVRNTSERHLKGCQLFWNVVWEGGSLLTMEMNPAARPFDLRPDEARRFPILTTNFDDATAGIRPSQAFLTLDGWRQLQNNPELAPGTYTFALHVLSEDTTRATNTLMVSHDGKDWTVRVP